MLAGRDSLLRRAGWDVGRGLAGGPAIRVLAGRERHDSVDLALRYAGLPSPELVDVDREGRVVPESLRDALDRSQGTPTLVLLQAGNLHSGACDPFEECVRLAHDHDAWVHVDGAFGLWAAASPAYRHLTAGVEAADSWATDAHKTLNVPYDCGVVLVRDAAALTAAMSMHGDYLIQDDADAFARVPEMSRRARGVPVWAALRASGRSGVAETVDRLCRHARTFAEAIAAIDGAEVVNDVVFTQVCATFGDDDATRAVVARMLEDGTAWTTGSRWRGRAVLRISVSNASTTDDDVARTVEALRRAAADALAQHPVVQVDDAAAEPALVEQLEVEPDAVGQPRRPAADDHRVHELVQLVDQPGAQRLRGERRPADRDVAVGGGHEAAHRRRVEVALQAGAGRAHLVEGAGEDHLVGGPPDRRRSPGSRRSRRARRRAPCPATPTSRRTSGGRRGRCRRSARGR